MHHETALLATLAIGHSFALIGGYLAVRLRQPPALGARSAKGPAIGARLGHRVTSVPANPA